MSTEYEEFLKSPEWLEKSRALKERQPRCELCGRMTDLRVHHTAYTDDLLDEKHLVVLCKECHEMTHYTINKIKELYAEKKMLMAYDTQEVLAQATLEFYKKSFIKKGCTINIFDLKTFSKYQDFLAENLNNHIYHNVYIAEGNTVDWKDLHFEVRSKELMKAARMRIIIGALKSKKYTEAQIRISLKMSYNSWKKTIDQIRMMTGESIF